MIDSKSTSFVIRAPNWIGDAVMAEPIFGLLKEEYPESKICCLASPAICEIYQNHPHIDSFLPFLRSKKEKKKEAKRIRQVLKKSSFDIGLLLTGSFSSALQFYQAKISRRIGFATHWRSLFLTDAVEDELTDHLVQSYKRLLMPLGISAGNEAPKLYLSEEEKTAAEKTLAECHLDKESFLIGLNPGAAYGMAKCWPKENYAALAQKLLEDKKFHLLFFGDKSSKEFIDSICPQNNPRVHNFAGKTNLRQLAALIHATDLFITNDSGPMHIAQSLDTPIVAIFGSTNPSRTGPFNCHDSVIYKQVSCSPCYLRACPIDFRCMKSISVDDVCSTIYSKLL